MRAGRQVLMLAQALLLSAAAGALVMLASWALAFFASHGRSGMVVLGDLRLEPGRLGVALACSVVVALVYLAGPVWRRALAGLVLFGATYAWDSLTSPYYPRLNLPLILAATLLLVFVGSRRARLIVAGAWSVVLAAAVAISVVEGAAQIVQVVPVVVVEPTVLLRALLLWAIGNASGLGLTAAAPAPVEARARA